jgi:hypothetical protein
MTSPLTESRWLTIVISVWGAMMGRSGMGNLRVRNFISGTSGFSPQTPGKCLVGKTGPKGKLAVIGSLMVTAADDCQFPVEVDDRLQVRRFVLHAGPMVPVQHVGTGGHTLSRTRRVLKRSRYKAHLGYFRLLGWAQGGQHCPREANAVAL